MSFGGILRQSTAVDVLIGPFVDSGDGDTEETGLTIAQADVRLSKNGQTAAQKNDVTSAAHDADGFYNCELDATDTNTVGQLVLYVHVAGALAVRHDFQIVEEAAYDAIFATSASPATAAGVSAVETDTQDIQSRLGTPTDFGSGTSTLAANLQDIADNGTAAFDRSTDSLQAIRDRGDAAWATATGFSTHSAADVRTEIDANSTQLAAIVADTNELQTDDIPGLIAALNDLSLADVNGEMLDVLNTDTFSQPGQGAPPATTTLVNMLAYLYKALRNKKDQTSSTWQLYNDDGSTVDQKSTVSDDGTTTTKGEIASGP